MIKNYSISKMLSTACILFFLTVNLRLFSQITQTFSYTGAMQSFTVPACVSSVTLETWGAQGAAGTATTINYGGYAKAVFTVTAGNALNMFVGGQPTGAAGGFNGGGVGDAGGQGGGGASDVRLNGTALSDRIIVAGGGGGGGIWTLNGEAIVGGTGGGLTGGDGSRVNYLTNPGGQGATQSGSGNGTCGTTNNPSVAGGLGVGGNSPVGGCGCDGYGGGGGYYGGAASGNCRGGGGGSGYILATATGTTFSSGTNTGNGKIVLSYFTNGSGVVTSTAVAVCSGSTATLSASNVSSYTWSPGGSNASSITITPTSNSTYTVQGTNSIGCISSAVINVTVSTATPSLAVTSSTPSTCYGNTVTISASGAITYTFSNGVVNGVPFIPTPGVNNYTVTGSTGCGISTSVTTVTVSALPLPTTVSSTLLCAGQPATLAVSGATTYSWAPITSTMTSVIVNPTTTTVYSVTGTSGACSGISTITITAKPNPTLNVSASASIICSGDMVSLTVAGNAVSYSWSPTGQPGTSISDFPANTTLYSVTGTNSVSCSSTAQKVIYVNPLPVVNASASNPLVCSGGSSTLAASGASMYAWTGGSGATTSTMVVNPVTDETYTITGTSSLSCSASTVVTVSIFSPTISITSAIAICAGSSAMLGAGVADTYLWSNGQSGQNTTVNPSLTTVYTVTASVNNLNGLSCPTTNTVQVTVNSNPTVTAASAHTAICVGQSATLTADGAGATGTYTWTGGQGAVVSASSVVTPIADQVYTVTGTDANGCKGKGTYNLVVSQCTGISVISPNTANLFIYPNPSSGEFNISVSEAITLQITNSLGQQVRTINMDKNTTSVSISLPDGIYFISGKNENGRVKQKLVISK